VILEEFSSAEDGIFTNSGAVVFEEGDYVVQGLSPLIRGYSIVLFDSNALSWKGDALECFIPRDRKKVYSLTPGLEGSVYDIRGQLLALAKLELRSLRQEMIEDDM
jgi:hypothetical protein